MLFVTSLSFCVPWRSNFDKLASARQPAIFVVVLKVFVSRKGENSGYESVEEKTGRTADQFLRPNRTTHFFIERISNTRTVWSRDPLVSRFPCGAHARACMVFCGEDCRHCISAFYPIPIPETYNVKSAVPVGVGRHFMYLTTHTCPVRIGSSRVSAKGQTRTVGTSLAVAKRSSSGTIGRP
jgi:hypothetical protein